MNREAERKRLVELIENFFEKKIGASFVKGFLDKFADNILDDGWMRPPVKVGDNLYYIPFGSTITKWEIKSIEIKQDDIVFHCGRTFFFKTDIGKTVFTSREDALKALEGSGEK